MEDGKRTGDASNWLVRPEFVETFEPSMEYPQPLLPRRTLYYQQQQQQHLSHEQNHSVHTKQFQSQYLEPQQAPVSLDSSPIYSASSSLSLSSSASSSSSLLLEQSPLQKHKLPTNTTTTIEQEEEQEEQEEEQEEEEQESRVTSILPIDGVKSSDNTLPRTKLKPFTHLKKTKVESEDDTGKNEGQDTREPEEDEREKNEQGEGKGDDEEEDEKEDAKEEIISEEDEEEEDEKEEEEEEEEKNDDDNDDSNDSDGNSEEGEDIQPTDKKIKSHHQTSHNKIHKEKEGHEKDSKTTSSKQKNNTNKRDKNTKKKKISKTREYMKNNPHYQWALRLVIGSSIIDPLYRRNDCMALEISSMIEEWLDNEIMCSETYVQHTLDHVHIPLKTLPLRHEQDVQGEPHSNNQIHSEEKKKKKKTTKTTKPTTKTNKETEKNAKKKTTTNPRKPSTTLATRISVLDSSIQGVLRGIGQHHPLHAFIKDKHPNSFVTMHLLNHLHKNLALVIDVKAILDEDMYLKFYASYKSEKKNKTKDRGAMKDDSSGSSESDKVYGGGGGGSSGDGGGGGLDASFDSKSQKHVNTFMDNKKEAREDGKLLAFSSSSSSVAPFSSICTPTTTTTTTSTHTTRANTITATNTTTTSSKKILKDDIAHFTRRFNSSMIYYYYTQSQARVHRYIKETPPHTKVIVSASVLGFLFILLLIFISSLLK